MKLSLFKRRLSKSQISCPCEPEVLLPTPDSSVKDNSSDTNQESLQDHTLIESRNSFSIENGLHRVVSSDSDLTAIQNLNDGRSRLMSRYYIFDKPVFEASLLLNEAYDIFAKSGAVTHLACGHVLPGLIQVLRERIKNGKSELSATEVFAPTLEQLRTEKLLHTKTFITQLFPHQGCSLRKGPKLMEILHAADTETIVISIRVLILLLPGGLLTGANFEEFVAKEEKLSKLLNKTVNGFYQILPTCLPTDIHPYLLQQFLELVVTAWSGLTLGTLDLLMDVAYSALALCFHTPPDDGLFDKDLYFYKQFYAVRNAAFQRILIGYMTAQHGMLLPPGLSYPPQKYQTPFVEHGLVVLVPKHRISKGNLCDLVDSIAKSQALVYLLQDALYFDEGVFLRRFCRDPYRTLSCDVSQTSLDYLEVFDNDKELLERVKQKKAFEGKPDSMNSSEMVENLIRVSKLVMSRWFVNTWKYETLMGNLCLTFVFELKKPIGQVNWLIITCDGQKRGTVHDGCVDPERQKEKEVKSLIIDMVNDQDGMFVISEEEEKEREEIRAPVTPPRSRNEICNIFETPTKGRKRRHSQRDADREFDAQMDSDEAPTVSMLKTSPRCKSFKDIVEKEQL